MREFYGKSAKQFFQTNGKERLVMPAVSRHLPKAGLGERCLDVGCGTVLFYDLIAKQGYKYYGLDQSQDMIDRAVESHPEGGYVIAPATDFAQVFNGRFDAMLLSLVLPSISEQETMQKILAECRKTLKEGCTLLVAVIHPAFDHYMKVGLFGARPNVRTSFSGYFSSGSSYKTQRRDGDKTFVYQNYHWTLSDYFDIILRAGFQVTSIDECPPGEYIKEDKDYFDEKNSFPTFLLLVCR